MVDDFRRGVTVLLDLASDEGVLLIRDSAPAAEVQAALTRLKTGGWHEVDDPDAVEPIEFPDGAVGVKAYLYKI